MLIGSWTRPEPGKTRRDLVVGTVIGVIGIASMALSIVMIKEVLNNSAVLWATWVRLAAAAIGLVPMVLLSPRRRVLLTALKPSASWRFPLIASVVGTYLAMMCWIGGMKHVEVSVATTLNQLSTIFIFVLATLFLKEPLTRRRVLAIALAFAGGLLVTLRQLFA
jgi:drug/metabolite transporter (DMT)-like permease